jgi:hypothetical protein
MADEPDSYSSSPLKTFEVIITFLLQGTKGAFGAFYHMHKTTGRGRP